MILSQFFSISKFDSESDPFIRLNYSLIFWQRLPRSDTGLQLTDPGSVQQVWKRDQTRPLRQGIANI